MADMIANVNGMDSFAYANKEAWHKKGQQLLQGASIEEWQVAAGMDWDIIESTVQFYDQNNQLLQMNDKKVLHRSDNNFALSVVGDKYKVVQPKEILEFFRDLVSDTGMYLDAAGCLHNGEVFWANANTSKVDYVGRPDDIVKGNLLLLSGCTGTISSSAQMVAERAVCANTIKIATAEQTNTRVRVTHRQQFDHELVKRRLGLFDDAWGNYIAQCNKFASKKVSDADAAEVFQALVYTDPVEPSPQSVTQFDLLMDLYRGGMGANMTYGNAYGILNAITERVDHHSRGRSDDKKFMDKFTGAGDKMKQDCFDLLCQIA